jgi:polyisoprenoid-binding protein YceI
MLGDLTIRGVTKPVTWDVTAKIAQGSISGEAKTSFTFVDFELGKPRVRSVLSVNDEIGLEYTFFLVAR